MRFDLTDLPDLSSLTPEELRTLYAQAEELYHEVETQEPDEEDEEYEDWLNDLEEIEDLMDEIEERLEWAGSGR